MARKGPEIRTRADQSPETRAPTPLFTVEIAEALESYIPRLLEVEEDLEVIWAKVKWFNTQVHKSDCPG